MDSCEKAFIELKQRLSSDPVLAFPRLGENFVVDVDEAFGGVLMQKGLGELFHPVAYFSDTEKPSQKKWALITRSVCVSVDSTPLARLFSWYRI